MGWLWGGAYKGTLERGISFEEIEITSTFNMICIETYLKYLVLIIFLLLKMGSTSAQESWTRVYDHTARAEARQIHRINDSTILLLGKKNLRRCPSTFIQVWDQTVNESWEKENWSMENVGQSVEVLRENIYDAGAGFLNLTDGYDSTLLYIAKYNLSGDTLFYHLLVGDLNDIDSVQQWKVVDLDVSPDDQLLLSFPNFYIVADNLGNFSPPVSIPNIQTLIKGYFYSLDSYLMADSTSVMLVDSMGTILQRRTFEDPVLDMHYVNNQESNLLYVLTSQKIYLLEENLFTTDSLPLSQIFSRVEGINIYENKIFIKGITSDSSRTEIQELNLDLNINTLHNFDRGDINLFRYTPQGFFYTAPASTIQLKERFSINFQSFDYPEPEVVEENISIEAFDIEVVYIDKVDVPNIDPFIAGFEFNFSVLCKNIGSGIINTLGLFMDLDGSGYFCVSDPLYYHKYRDLNLKPGDSIVLEGMVFQLGSNDDFCIELVNPNSKIEPDTTQNILCMSFNNPELIVSNDKLIPSEVNIFPNPVEDIITLERTSPGARDTDILVYDIHGKLVLKTPWHSNSLKIDIGYLPPGVYLVVWDEKNLRYTRKFLKM